MAEFQGVSTDAAALPTAVTPQKGVVDSSKALATESLAQSISQGGKGIAKFLGSFEGEEDTVIGDFMREQLKIVDAVAQGMKRSAAGTRARANLVAALAANPGRAMEISQAHGAIMGDAGLGKTISEETSEARRLIAFADAAFAAGHVKADGTADVGNYSDFLDIEREAGALSKKYAIVLQEIAIPANRTSAEQADLNLELQLLEIDGRNLLVKTVGNQRVVLTTKLKDLFRRSNLGEIDANQVAATLGELRSVIDQQVNTYSTTAGTTFANDAAQPLYSLIDAYEEIIAGGKITSALKNKLERLKTETHLAMIVKNPEFLRFMIVSQAFKSIPLQLLPQAQALMMDIMEKTSPVEPPPGAKISGGKFNLMDPENEEAAANYLETMLGILGVNSDDNPELKIQTMGQLEGILKSIDVYQASVEDTKEYKTIVKFLANPIVGKALIEADGINVEVAAKAAEIFESQYINKLLPVIRDFVANSNILRRSKTDAGVGRAVKISKIQIVPIFKDTGVLFVMEDGSSGGPQLAKINDDVGKILNQLIRIDSHLSGTLKYRQTWERSYKELFAIKDVEEGEGFTLKRHIETLGDKPSITTKARKPPGVEE